MTDHAIAITMPQEQPRKPAIHASALQSCMDDIVRNAKEFGSDHTAVAESQNTLGLFYHHVNHEQEKALLCHVKALKILYNTSNGSIEEQRQQQDQQQHRDTIIEMGITITDIGNVQWALGNFRKAMWAFEDSLAVFISASLEHNHPRIVSTRNRLKILLEDFRARAKSIGNIAEIDEIDNILMQGTAYERLNYSIDRYCTCT